MLFIVKRNKKVKVIDIAIPGDVRVKEKEMEMTDKYQRLRDEMKRLWNMDKVSVNLLLLMH